MSLNEFLNDKKYTAAFFLLALCFFLLDWYLFAAVGEKEEHIRRLETETALLENRAKLPKRSSRMPFLETLLEDTTADTVFSAFMESGCAVEEIKERFFFTNHRGLWYNKKQREMVGGGALRPETGRKPSCL